MVFLATLLFLTGVQGRKETGSRWINTESLRRTDNLVPWSQWGRQDYHYVDFNRPVPAHSGYCLYLRL